MKYLWSALLAFVVLIGINAQAQAPDNGPAAAADTPLIDVLRFFRELDLSADQKHQIAEIVKRRRPEIRPQVDELIAARVELSRSLRRAEGYDDAAKAAHARVMDAERAVVQTRAAILQEVSPILSVEQRALVDKAQNGAVLKLGSRLEKVRAFVDWWVDRQLES